MSVSVLVLTLNEEISLSECLRSVAWSDDIVVFDSYSSDRTVKIAQAAGARFFQRKFDNYAAQRNAALNVDYKYPWVLIVDADERVTPELSEEIKKVLNAKKQDDTTLYRIRRKDMFMGRWLRYASGHPTWFGRLSKGGRVNVKREINEEYHTNGQVGYLKEYLIHYPFNKGISLWFERHNLYSSMEAKILIKDVKKKLHIKQLFSSDPTLRRKFLKQLAYRLPCRPFLVFCYIYFFRLGFLDGTPGLTYCWLRSIYEYMIDIKVSELRRMEKDLPI